MLLTLRIQDFVLIDEIELRLEPGYNVVTGETGAGKSILVGALNLVLGGRARADLVRPGAREATIEALFDIQSDEALSARLDEAGIICDGELLVRRVVQKNGRSRAYLNGRMCTVSELSELALQLADVTSQHESVALSDSARHIDYLDRYAGLTDEREQLARVVDDLNETLDALRTLSQREQSRGEREDFLRYQLEQIDSLDPQAGELEELESRRQRLQHARRLGELTGNVLGGLEGQSSWSEAYGSDDHDRGGAQTEAICDKLGRLSSDLSAAADLDSDLSPVAQELEDCWARLSDVAGELSTYSTRLDADPAALEQVQERLFALQDLMRKHGPTLNEVLSARAAIADELSALDHGDEQRVALDTKRTKLAKRASERARALSRKRRRAARDLGKSITAQLQNLGMGSARVLVEVSPTAPQGNANHQGDPSLLVDGGRLSRHGVDRVELLIAPNKGLDPRPLARIASGGELSRALLAVKRVLGGYEGGLGVNTRGRAIGVQVFDEVDSGVGGATADKIGHCIADIACHRQVLCITHLAAIAACADAHFVVSKHDQDETTTSRIQKIGAKERVTEIARMLTGENKTRASQRAAAEMITNAATARSEREAKLVAAAE